MGPRLREDDGSDFVSFKTVIPAQAGTHDTCEQCENPSLLHG
jgi:hypothetical protein